jgi:hypothetical protein
MLLYFHHLLSGRRSYQIILAIAFILSCTPAFSQEYRKIKAKRGDGIYGMLKQNGLSPKEYMGLFIELNKTKLGKENSLIIGREYRLPKKAKRDSVIEIDTPVKEFGFYW